MKLFIDSEVLEFVEVAQWFEHLAPRSGFSRDSMFARQDGSYDDSIDTCRSWC
jgi:hypothetical protein